MLSPCTVCRTEDRPVMMEFSHKEEREEAVLVHVGPDRMLFKQSGFHTERNGKDKQEFK